MTYLQRIPAPPLDRSIACLWYFRGEPRPHALERVLPNGSAQLIVNLAEDQTRGYVEESNGLRVVTAGGTILAGIQSRYGIIDTMEQEHVIGVSFRPGGTLPFFALPAYEACDRDLALDELWGRPALELRQQLLDAPEAAEKLDVLERALLRQWRPRRLHPAVGFALEALRRRGDAVRVAALADQAGLSAKRFIESFKQCVGLPPKQYERIVRFQTALAAAERGRVDWTRVAGDCGYFDQSHFIRDFRAFSGITPTLYGAGRTEFRNHVKFLQSPPAEPVR